MRTESLKALVDTAMDMSNPVDTRLEALAELLPLMCVKAETVSVETLGARVAALERLVRRQNPTGK